MNSHTSPSNVRPSCFRKCLQRPGATKPERVGKVKEYGSKEGGSDQGSSKSKLGGSISNHKCNLLCKNSPSSRNPQLLSIAFIPWSEDPIVTSFFTKLLIFDGSGSNINSWR